MKHDLTKYKVPCPDKKTGKTFKRILKYLGEPISDWYDPDFKSFPHHEVSLFLDDSRQWTLGVYRAGKEISFKQLIRMILENQAEDQPKKSILDGKRIEVNNEREFKLLMDHYESKGWRWALGELPNEYNPKIFPCYIVYNNGFSWRESALNFPKYSIVPFSDFAKEVGIKVPVFVMKSEDGVDLYEGDSAEWVVRHSINGIYRYLYNLTIDESHITGCLAEGKYFLFSTKEAAEKWVKEKNEPEEIEVDSYGLIFKVNKTGSVTSRGEADPHIDHMKTIVKAYEATFGTN